MHSRCRRSAFTLIELLVVIAIIAILAAILFPVFAQAKLAAKKTQALSNVKQIALASQMYIGDVDDVYAEAVSGGCTNDATTANKLWSALMYPYTKNRDIYKDPTDGQAWPGFRYSSSVALPEVGAKAYDTPCGTTGTAGNRGDLRAATLGLNRQFFSYYICGQDTGQIGCKLAVWEPAPTSGACSPYFTNGNTIESPASFVLLAPTTPDCGSAQTAYISSNIDPMNAKGGWSSISSRQGDGSSLAFADGHAKFVKAGPDSELATLAGNSNFRLGSFQNRGAVKRRLQGAATSANGTLNCVNHNPAKLQWSAFVAMPGENAALDALCAN